MSDTTALKDNDDNEKDSADNENEKYRILSAIAFIILIIIIGVPMWWKTTEVYRVSLPTSGIEDLNKVPIVVSSRIGIYLQDKTKLASIVSDLENVFAGHEFIKLKFIKIDISQSELHSVATPAALEKIIIQRYNFKMGEFMFIEWHKYLNEFLVTADRSAFISSQVSSSQIKNVLRYWLFDEYNLLSILGNLTTSAGKPIRHITAPAQPNYDILISVLNPRPDLQKINWNVRSAAEAYILPFLNAISSISNFTLKSQWKYQNEFEFNKQPISDDSKFGRHFALQEDRLPHIVTAIERKLGTEVSKNPSIHLIVYAPPCQNAPLRIYRKNGELASTNGVESFLSPGWGGIIIANPPESVCHEYFETQTPSEFHLSSQNIMPIGLYLLRKLFGIQNDVPIDKVAITELDTIEPRVWEVDTYVRTKVVHFLTSSTVTLKSLVKLLGDISYIVINDEVGIAINTAFEQIVIAKELLRNGNLEEAVHYAKEAFISSERAFFDPSLLALLYFPDEQKYAIYIPLFFPIMLPVVCSIYSLKKLFKKQDAQEKKDKKNEDDTDESDKINEDNNQDIDETETLIEDSHKLHESQTLSETGVKVKKRRTKKE